MDLPRSVLAAFQVEYREQLEGMRAFLAAHPEPGSPLDGALLQEAFRLAHSLKAGARVCDLRPMERLGHDLESLFDRLRGGTLELEREVQEAIARVLDAIEDWMGALGPHGLPPEPVEAVAGLQAVLEREARTGNAVRPSPAETAAPPPAAPGGGPGEPEGKPEGGTDVSAQSQAHVVAPIETVRVRAGSLDALLRSADRISMEGGRQDRLFEELGALEAAARRLGEEWTGMRRATADPLRPGADSDVRRLRRFLDVADELCTGLLHRAREVRTLQERGKREIRAIATDLRQGVRRARLVRAESVFHGFRRTCREIAHGHGREVDLHLRGLDVEADRMVLEALRTPVLHLLRNAVAHGIEPPDERERRGMTRAGVIELELRTDGNRLTLAIADDGPGVDVAAIARAAVAAGLLDEDEARRRGPDELAQLVFHPNLSTAPDVDELAGRGVGLSDVQTTVLRLRGTVRVRRAAERGARFEIDVPLSLATHRLLLVECGGRAFALPADLVEGLARIDVERVGRVFGRPCVRQHEESVPLFDLAALLRLKAAEEEARKGGRTPVVFLRVEARRVALAVEGFGRYIETIVKDVHGPAGGLPHVYGGVLRDDGDVVFVLDPAALFRGANVETGTRTNGEPRAVEGARRTRRILIVDDSFTTRTLEKSLLEAHGYEVIVAVDGREALARLRTHDVDLVISDVQMPGLDGMGVLQAIREEPRTAELPVIMVTSMDREDDRRRGMEFGANAYIVKQRFDHEELLETIEDLL